VRAAQLFSESALLLRRAAVAHSKKRGVAATAPKNVRAAWALIKLRVAGRSAAAVRERAANSHNRSHTDRSIRPPTMHFAIWLALKTRAAAAPPAGRRTPFALDVTTRYSLRNVSRIGTLKYF
jgi:hypothetical protein